MRKREAEETPKLYLSNAEGKWSVIYEGLPACRQYDYVGPALAVYDSCRERLGWKKTNGIPVWNGDKGQFEILKPDATAQRLAK